MLSEKQIYSLLLLRLRQPVRLIIMIFFFNQSFKLAGTIAIYIGIISIYTQVTNDVVVI